MISQFSDEDGLPDMIERTYTPSIETKIVAEGSEAILMLLATYEIRNKEDHGDGRYNSSAHQVYEFYIDGSDTFVLAETHSYSASVNCSIEAAIEVIRAGAGFEFGELHELHFQRHTELSNMLIRLYSPILFFDVAIIDIRDPGTCCEENGICSICP